MKTSLLLNVAKMVIPFIQIFGAYVILFGHLSPGGGFSGGGILGASLILYRFVYGKEAANNKFKYTTLKWIASGGVMLYGFLKGTLFVLDFYHLEAFHLVGTPGSLLSGGFILPLNILVGIVVAITFYFFAVLFEEGELECNS